MSDRISKKEKLSCFTKKRKKNLSETICILIIKIDLPIEKNKFIKKIKRNKV